MNICEPQTEPFFFCIAAFQTYPRFSACLTLALELVSGNHGDPWAVWNSDETVELPLAWSPWSSKTTGFLRTTPFGPYGGLLLSFLYREHPEETPERLEQLGAGTGAADIEYEQFLKAKEARIFSIQSQGGRYFWLPLAILPGATGHVSSRE